MCCWFFCCCLCSLHSVFFLLCVRFQMDFVQEVLFFAFSPFTNEKLLHCSASHSLGEYVYVEVSNFRLNQDSCGITVKKIHISFILTFIFFNKRFGLFFSLFLLFSPFFYLRHTFSTLYYMLDGCTFQHASLIFRWKLDGTNTIFNSHILWIGLKSHNSNEPWLKEVLENLLPFQWHKKCS